MKILVSGSSGLIGSHLVPALRARGQEVFSLKRRSRTAGEEVPWTPDSSSPMSGYDAVVHLAGEPIAGRWTPDKKARIRNSRIAGTHHLAGALARTERKPQSLLVASAVGYYGSRGNEILTEDSPPGGDFLARVARDWETAAAPAREAGIRVVHLRFGMVLTPQGGALRQMLTPFRLGLGGRIGPGTQWVSWIALEDAVGAILFALENAGANANALAGPVNVVAPNPVTNADFTRALGKALHRPTLFPLPKPLVKLMLGEMGETLLLASQRAIPKKLLAEGFGFRHPDLAEALQSMLA